MSATPALSAAAACPSALLQHPLIFSHAPAVSLFTRKIKVSGLVICRFVGNDKLLETSECSIISKIVVLIIRYNSAEECRMLSCLKNLYKYKIIIKNFQSCYHKLVKKILETLQFFRFFRVLCKNMDDRNFLISLV